jgi:LCP family protein required for cell wall assembly
MQKMHRPARSNPIAAKSKPGRGVALSWSTLLLGILLLSLVASVAYASTAVYQWARQAVSTLPGVSDVDLPSVVLPAADSQTGTAGADAAIEPITPRAAASVDLPLPLGSTDQRDRITVLLLGTDQRPDDPSPPRTDNMIVVTADLHSGKVGMISLPRDMFVPIPGFDRSGKINTAYTVGESNKYPGGGGELAKKTVSELLGYPIDYYIKLNFDGFVRIVDLIGGIDMQVPKAIHDEEYPTMDYGYTTFHIDAGFHHLDGETALKYVRTRHADDDFERARRQQAVLLAIKDRFLEQKLLATLKIFDIMDVLSSSVEHDIPPADMLDLVALASDLTDDMDISQIDQLVLDTHYGRIDADSPYGWIIVPDRTKIRPAVDRIFANTTAKPRIDQEALARLRSQQQAAATRQQVQNSYEAQAETLRSQLAAEGARIALLDGAGDATLASRAADWLRRQGYNIVEHGQADRSDYQRTVLQVYADKPHTVANLRDSFAIAADNIRREAESDNSADLRLIIGRDFYLLVSN